MTPKLFVQNLHPRPLPNSEQPAGPEHLSSPELLALVPGLIMVGQDNPLQRSPNQPYPEVMYHAADTPSFSFNDFFDHQQTPGYNKILGAGLYCCDKQLATKYQALRKGDVATILPYQATMLDRSAPDYDQPLPRVFLQAFVDKIAATPTRPHQFFEAADAKKLLASNIPVQLDDLLTYLDTRGSSQPSYIQSFLTDIGVDGIFTTVMPSADKGNAHRIAAFWRHHNIGDRGTWQKRAEAQLRTQGRLSAFMPHFVAVEPVRSSEAANVSEAVLSRPARLTPNEAQVIEDELQKAPIISQKQAAQLFNSMSQATIDPFNAVKTLASLSPVADKLLSADTGVWEGYRLHEHTQAVLGQFERFIAPRYNTQPGESNHAAGLVRTVLLLQDFGKPLAQGLDGHTRNQAEFNKLAAGNIINSLPLSEPMKSLVIDLIGQDIIGTVLKDKTKLPAMARQLSQLTHKHAATLEADRVFQTMNDIFMSDAASYTASASYRDGQTSKLKHCKPSPRLEAAFKPITPQVNRLKLNDDNLSTLRALITLTNQLNSNNS